MQGTPFGRYRLLQRLGQGGMGEVWRAHDTETDRVVAVKVLLPHLTRNPGFERRFRREAYIAAALSEPHVVPIHNFGEIDGQLYVDMRLVEGRDLQTVLAGGRLAPERAVAIVEQVAAALRAAHKAGLVHRDVKPSNILITDDDFAYLIDFGIARAVDETGLTTTGGVMGTWTYMAPERFSAEADPRADIYALACVLHECLTGTRPFYGNTLEQQYAAHLFSPPPCASLMAPGIPAAMDAVIAKGMAKNPDHRYQDAMALAKAARAALTAPVTPMQPTPANRPVSERAPDRKRQPGRAPAGVRAVRVRWWRRKVTRGRAIAVLAVPLVVCVATIVFTAFTTRLYLEDRGELQAKEAIARTAADAITTMWSYTPENIDGLSARAAEFLEGDFGAQYSKYVDQILWPNKQAKVTNATEVLAVGVESLVGSEAAALVYSNTTTTSQQTDVPSLKYLSYRVVMRKHGSRWLLARMTTVTSLELTPQTTAPK